MYDTHLQVHRIFRWVSGGKTESMASQNAATGCAHSTKETSSVAYNTTILQQEHREEGRAVGVQKFKIDLLFQYVSTIYIKQTLKETAIAG